MPHASSHNPFLVHRFNAQAGIALGPILFIIAILAILAAAIAAGSGSFNASTTAEGNKAKAAAIIQIGDGLRVGMDRLTMENSIAFNQWTINSVNTSNNIDLFAPAGGGITPPSIGMAASPATDVWYYPQGAIPDIGTYSVNTANTLQLAVLNVSAGVCAEVNFRANGQSIAPAAKALGNFAMPVNAGNIASTMNAGWPNTNNATSMNLYDHPVGCVQNSDPGSSGYYFYEVLFVQ